MNKVHLCSFADSRMVPMLNRLNKQALQFKIFDSILFYNEKNFDDEFKETFKEWLTPKVRGFGYWVWKPYIIGLALDMIDEGDILLYVDAGSHLNVRGISRFYDYLKMVENSLSNFLTFHLEGAEFIDKYWTKGDVFDFFYVRNDTQITDTPMRDASAIFMKKTDFSISFINKWLSVFKDHLSLIDNSSSVSPNFEGFIEHRYDQSIFSVLAKIDNLDVISNSEISSTNWKSMLNFPILEKKDKRIKLRYRYSLKRFIKKMIISWRNKF